MPFSQTVTGGCPGGWCDFILVLSEVLVVVLLADCFIFLVTLIPPLFSWKAWKPDSRRRIFFAAFACLTFYFWLGVLAIHSVYCFGFLAHAGPCSNLSGTASPFTPLTSAPMVSDNVKQPLTEEAGQLPDVVSSLPDSVLNVEPANGAVSTAAGNNGGNMAGNFGIGNNDAEGVFSRPDEHDDRHKSPSEDEAAVATPDEEGEHNHWHNGSGIVSDGNLSLAATAERFRDVSLAEEREKCSSAAAENSLKVITLINVLIIILLLIVVAANVNEAMNAKALYYCETLCRKEEVQRFLSSLTSKRPEVGHLVKCFHTSKSTDSKTNSTHKVVTYSTVENFHYQTWKDFSDPRLIEPSSTYPIIEVEIVLNFFPGDHATADKYKEFVQKLTKENSGKDAKISIDDYFHIEDQREWSFFIGNNDYIVPWWEKGVARVLLSCVFMIGWPFRLSYSGQIAKHRIEIKKAVFCENNSQDEGVSLTATPGSSTDGCNSSKQGIEANRQDSSSSIHSNNQAEDGDDKANSSGPREHKVDVQVSPPPTSVTPPTTPGSGLRSEAANNDHNDGGHQPAHQQQPYYSQPANSSPSSYGNANNNANGSHTAVLHHHQPREQREDLHLPDRYPQQQHHPAVASYNSSNHSPDRSTPILNRSSGVGPANNNNMMMMAGNHPLRSAPLASPRTHIRETTKDIVTAVTHHHHDINGMNAVSTVAIRDMDMQMGGLAGYETYV